MTAARRSWRPAPTRGSSAWRATARHPAPDEAEIAVVVEDGWQRKGLGTILLSALLDHGRSRGISRFLAHVLADNQRMLRLIGRLGTVTERSLDQGIVTVRFTPRPDAPPAEPASTLGNSG